MTARDMTGFCTSFSREFLPSSPYSPRISQESTAKNSSNIQEAGELVLGGAKRIMRGKHTAERTHQDNLLDHSTKPRDKKLLCGKEKCDFARQKRVTS